MYLSRKIIFFVSIGLVVLYFIATRLNTNWSHSIGDVVDSLNGVPVYYNGGINHVSERNLTPDGYNLGLRYQCVEFVKRYYYVRFGHKMPQDKGHAKNFFNPTIGNGELNRERNLIQYINGAGDSPQPEDLIIFSPWVLNRYGHVAIVSEVGADYVEAIQQNPGPFGPSRERFKLTAVNGKFIISHTRVLGWLRLQQSNPSFIP